MALDIAKMTKRLETAKEDRASGDFFEPKMGWTKLYIHPPCDPDDDFELTAGLNYLEYKIHYQVNGVSIVSLDTEANPILLHPRVQEFLAARGIEIDPERPCPVAEWLKAQDAAQQKASRIQSRYIWGVTPISFSEKKGVWTPIETFRPSPYPCSFTVWDGIMNKLIEDPKCDPTDPDRATLIVLNKAKKDLKKRGEDAMNVKYDVDFDVLTTRKPMAFSKAQKAALEKAMLAGGDCDLFRVMSNLVKSYEDVEEIIEKGGVETEEEEPKRRPTTKPATRVAVEEDADEPAEEEGEEPAEEEAAEEGAEEEATEEEVTEGEEEATEEEAGEEGEGEEEPAEDDAGGEEGALEVERPDGAPECYALDIEPETETCRACPFKAGCAGVLGVEVPADLPPKKPATVKTAAPAKPSTAPAGKPAAKPAAGAPAKPAAKPGAAPAKPGAVVGKVPATAAKTAAAKPSGAAKAPGSPKAAPKPAAEPEPEGLEDIEAELDGLAEKRTAAKTAAMKHGKK